MTTDDDFRTGDSLKANSIKPRLNRAMKGDCHGTKAERRLCGRLGGRLTKASGALDFDKGDIKLGEFLIECKSTVNDSLSLKKSWLDKISIEALQRGKRPALALEFVNIEGAPVTGGSWVAIPEHVFKELLDCENPEDH